MFFEIVGVVSSKKREGVQMTCFTSCEDLAIKLKNELYKEDRKNWVYIIAGFLWTGQLLGCPNEMLISAILETEKVTLAEIDSAIEFYTHSAFCCDDPAECARHLKKALPALV
jgi:hypothetical protein